MEYQMNRDLKYYLFFSLNEALFASYTILVVLILKELKFKIDRSSLILIILFELGFMIKGIYWFVDVAVTFSHQFDYMIFLSEIADFSIVILFIYFAFEMRLIYIVFQVEKIMGFRQRFLVIQKKLKLESQGQSLTRFNIFMIFWTYLLLFVGFLQVLHKAYLESTILLERNDLYILALQIRYFVQDPIIRMLLGTTILYLFYHMARQSNKKRQQRNAVGSPTSKDDSRRNYGTMSIIEILQKNTLSKTNSSLNGEGNQVVEVSVSFFSKSARIQMAMIDMNRNSDSLDQSIDSERSELTQFQSFIIEQMAMFRKKEFQRQRANEGLDSVKFQQNTSPLL
ncbi:UNKNOWN [Stylonychia lemnae]|uniref:Transmembrane protein n=1 Tax=Stylonychia lemnae TaxID=5949 RepID=A0A078B492_STYLE|nr:UNKNOWN [Stylonychia lemnae]|eukprot:CDW89294.1 UNKNOWN [Stylonychia lemnae]